VENRSHRPTWQTLLAFAIIYLVWGSTFLAIRVGVREVPPFLLAAMRFLIAGLVLYGSSVARGARSPSGRQWMSAFLLALLIFVLDYGLLFWAEKRVPSGVAAVMMATIPVFMALSEIIFLRTQRLTVRLASALLIGIAGVAVLMSRSLHFAGAPIDTAGAVALTFDKLVGSLSAYAQTAAAIIQSDEFRHANAGWRSATHSDSGHARRISQLPCREGLLRYLVVSGIFDCRGLNCCVHSIPLADSS
jgi:drug/metabolite transporter (DMT)-like permease